MGNVKQDLINIGLPPEVSNYLGNLLGPTSSVGNFSAKTVSNNYSFYTDTSDSADTAILSFCGGGGDSSGRGARLVLRGNENTSGYGGWEAYSGNVSAGYIYLSALGASSSIQFACNSLERWRIAVTGDLTQEATNGGNINISKAGTGLRQPIATGISAAGTIITDATDLTAIHSDVTTVGASSGVQLWAAAVGMTLTVTNRGANDLKVYPSAAGDQINAAGAGAAVTVAVGEMGIFNRLTSTLWNCAVGVAP